MEEKFSFPYGLDAISLNVVEPPANLFCIHVEVKVKVLNRIPDGEGRHEVLASISYVFSQQFVTFGFYLCLEVQFHIGSNSQHGWGNNVGPTIFNLDTISCLGHKAETMLSFLFDFMTMCAVSRVKWPHLALLL